MPLTAGCQARLLIFKFQYYVITLYPQNSPLNFMNLQPWLWMSPRSRLITASDIKALVEDINQKIDGMATRLSMIEQCVSMAPQNPPQPTVRECPVRDNLRSGTSARQWPSAGQSRPCTSGVRSRSSSASQTTGSSKEDPYDYRDPHEPEASCLEDDNCN